MSGPPLVVFFLGYMSRNLRAQVSTPESALSASSLSTPSTPSDGHGPAQMASRAFGVEQAAVRTLLAVAISVQRSFEAGALVPYYSDMPTLREQGMYYDQ